MDKAIEAMLDAFIAADRPSMLLANEIEVALDDAYPDNDYVQDLVGMLAMYRPEGGEGGEFLYDAEAIRAKLVRERDYLSALAN
ncbi:hypothetical protein JVX98_10370 [Ensifer sp. PDNC004]|uniref:hypothetical protein n=1 Tax=Ensifer sp. PDNC004 TaxID=2811423 RepID=UPI0019652F28|nr:hypothetical protein [Ensifer sp. PDNC004]QRY68649.1 hypothetical protein JVX98_10370 [Ensifer sp. PDNC004]